MKLPKLYKNGNRGLEEWSTWVKDSGCYAAIIVQWGLVGGKLQIKETIIPNGKNIGKSNETSYLQQAELECKSKWKKNLDKGYFENIGDAQQGLKIRPMLAKTYQENKNKLKWPCFLQPKLDGMRALGMMDDKPLLVSRKGKNIETAEHILKELGEIFEQHPGIILDGELYKHGEDFQSLISAIKRDKANDKSTEVEYHIYDCFFPDKDLNFSKRLEILTELDTHTKSKLVFVKTYECNSEEDIFKYHAQFLKDKYEGSIVRNNAPYEIDKRSFNLLKLKEFQDAEFEITGYEIDKNGHCVFECITDEKKIFKVKPEGTNEYRTELGTKGHKYIGEKLTVQFFEYTNDGVPRFPVGHGIRPVEDL